MKDYRTRLRHPLLLVATLAGSFSSLLGIVVLAGWYTRTLVLIQVLPTFAPMQYNTACGFFLCGLGLICAIAGWSRTTRACSIVVSTLGLLTLLQYLFAIELGIDQLLMPSDIMVNTSHPGRMAPSTALCFGLSGFALLLLKTSSRSERRFLMSGALGNLVIVLGLSAFFGYLVDLETAHGWGRLASMALHTSVGFLLVGIGVMACAWHENNTISDESWRGVTTFVGMGGGVLTLLLWHALVVQGHAQIKQIIATEAVNIAEKVESRLQSRIEPLLRMAKRWEVRGGTPKAEWEADAALYVAHQPEYQAIEWVDPSYHVRWIVPLAGNEAAQDLDLASEGHRREALVAARAYRAPTLTRVIDLAQGGKGFLVYIPLYHGEAFGGFLLGVFRVQDFLAPLVVQSLTRGYAVALYDGDVEVDRQTDSGKVYAASWRHDTMLDMHNVTWRLRVWPDHTRLAQLQSTRPTLTLIIGLTLTGLLMLTAHVAHMTRCRAQEAEATNRELDAVNQQLQDEITERETAEAALRESEARLRAIVHTAADAILTIDDQGFIEFCNPASERMFGYSAEDMLGHNVSRLMPAPHRDTHDRYLARYCTTGEAKIIGIGREVEGRRQDGAVFPIDLSVSEVQVEDRRLFTGIVRDITERKQAEAALRRAHDELERRVQKRTAELAAMNEELRAEIEGRKQAEAALQRYATDLARSNAELDQFAYVASHDLKAPLRAIDHLAQWIADDAGEVLSEASRNDLALLQQRVGRMAALLDNLLAYSRIGRNQSESEDIDVGCLVEDILALFEIPETFTVSVASGLPTLQAPRAPVELVLRNLIGNALKHHDRADGHLEISGRDLGDAVELIVADDGPGIAPAYHAQIFQMFQTLKPRDQVEGSGMGLALVKKTVEHHGGTIAVESEETRGARFRLTWPKPDTRRT